MSSGLLDTIIYMKYGDYVGEAADEIVVRKQREYYDCGCFFWGYSGVICHPKTQVRPFAREAAASSSRILLVMSRTSSVLQKPRYQAREFSSDYNEWQTIPHGIAVYGSNFALVCGKLQECDITLDLSQYIVGVGPNKGKCLSDYIKYRVDKACARFEPNIDKYTSSPQIIKINLIAEVIEPYAVFLR